MDLLPEEQSHAIEDTTQQLSLLVLPLTEAKVSKVVKHVLRSQHCPNATLDTVPLEFLTGGNTSRDSFVKEFYQLHIYLNGSYHLHRLGRYHVLVLGNQRCRRYPASVVPPLAPASHHVKMVPTATTPRSCSAWPPSSSLSRTSTLATSSPPLPLTPLL